MLNSLIGTVSPELKAKGLEDRSQRVHHQRHNNDNNNKQQQQWQSSKINRLRRGETGKTCAVFFNK